MRPIQPPDNNAQLNKNSFLTYRKNDRKWKFKTSLTGRDVYKIYSRKSDNPVNSKVFFDILEGFVSAKMLAMIEKDEPFNLPLGLGHVCLVKKKQRILKREDGTPYIVGGKLDYVSTKKVIADLKEKIGEDAYYKIPFKERPRVFFSNIHSDMFRFEIAWYKKFAKRMKVKNIGYYDFIALRTWKRHLAKCIKDPNIHIDCLDVTKHRQGGSHD